MIFQIDCGGIAAGTRTERAVAVAEVPVMHAFVFHLHSRVTTKDSCQKMTWYIIHACTVGQSVMLSVS